MADPKRGYVAVRQLDADEIRELKPIITTRDLAGIGGLSMSTAQQMLRAGKFKTATRIGHTWRLSKAEALSFFGLEE